MISEISDDGHIDGNTYTIRSVNNPRTAIVGTLTQHQWNVRKHVTTVWTLSLTRNMIVINSIVINYFVLGILYLFSLVNCPFFQRRTP